jgi:hypothetical protein
MRDLTDLGSCPRFRPARQSPKANASSIYDRCQVRYGEDSRF